LPDSLEVEILRQVEETQALMAKVGNAIVRRFLSSITISILTIVPPTITRGKDKVPKSSQNATTRATWRGERGLPRFLICYVGFYRLFCRVQLIGGTKLSTLTSDVIKTSYSNANTRNPNSDYFRSPISTSIHHSQTSALSNNLAANSATSSTPNSSVNFRSMVDIRNGDVDSRGNLNSSNSNSNSNNKNINTSSNSRIASS